MYFINVKSRQSGRDSIGLYIIGQENLVQAYIIDDNVTMINTDSAQSKQTKFRLPDIYMI